jgi:hypothetical protein
MFCLCYQSLGFSKKQDFSHHLGGFLRTQINKQHRCLAKKLSYMPKKISFEQKTVLMNLFDTEEERDRFIYPEDRGVSQALTRPDK